MANDNSLVIKINGSAKDFLDELDKVKKSTKDLGNVLDKTAKVSAAAFAGFAASIALVTKSFADYEKALVGVGKTTDIQGQKLQKFGKEFQKLSKEIPVSTNELLGIAQAAGQLGVKGEKDLLKFTETIAKLGVATDLTGEQAATSLTRILNVTGESISSIDNFGSVIVALGNNFAATESEIVRVTTEVSRSTAVFGVSAAEAAGLATALKSVGVQAQLGGSAVGRSFRAIDKATREGGAALENLSRVTGIAGDQLRQTFEKDSTQVFQAFINGLGQITREGGDTTAALAAFGLKGDEILKVLPVLAKNSELVGDALNTAAKETRDATALNDEAAKAFATLDSTIQKAQNAFVNLSSNIGEKLAPQVTSLIEGITEVVNGISELDEETVGVIATFLKWGAIISGGIATLSTFALGALGVSTAIVAIDAAFLGGAIAASAFWTAVTGPIGLAVAGIAAVTAGAVALFNVLNSDETKGVDELQSKLSELKDEQLEVERVAKEGRLGERARAQLRLKELDKEIKKIEDLKAAKIEAANEPIDLTRPDDAFTGIESTGVLAPEEQSVVKTVEEKSKKDNSDFKANEDEKTKIAAAAEQERLQAAKDANEVALAQKAGAAATEIEILKEFQAIEQEQKNLNQIKDEERRELEKENLLLRQEEALANLAEFEELKEQQNQEFRDITNANETLNDEQKLQRIAAFEKANDKKRKDELKKEKILNKQRLQIQQQQDQAKLGLAAASADALIALSGDSAKAGLALSKSVAVAQAFLSHAQANAGVTAQAATLPPPAAPAYLAAGLANNKVQLGLSLATIAAQTVAGVARLQTGGFVGQGQGGARDRIPALLEPNELVVPAAQATPFLQAVGNPQSGDFGNADASSPDVSTDTEAGEKVLRLEGDLISNDDFVAALATKLREDQEFNNVSLTVED